MKLVFVFIKRIAMYVYFKPWNFVLPKYVFVILWLSAELSFQMFSWCRRKIEENLWNTRKLESFENSKLKRSVKPLLSKFSQQGAIQSLHTFFVWRLFMQLSNLRVNFYVNKIKVFPQIWRLPKSPHKKILHFSLLLPF